MAKEIPWTFKSWIAEFKNVDLPIGDFAKDVVSDDDFPDVESFIDIFEYLQDKKASLKALDAFVNIWTFYTLSK